MPDNTKTETEPEALKYDRDRLVAESEDFFGQPGFIVAGALADLDARRINFTRAEVESAVKAWLRKPVSADQEAK